jgi:hypothetical protein
MQKIIFLTALFFIKINLNSQTLIVTPNPFYQRALASFTITNADSISLQVVDITGKIILTPRPTSFLSPGIYQDSIILDTYPPGIYYVSLKIKSGGSQSTKLVKTGPVGIQQLTQNSNLSIYPNPFQNHITLEYENSFLKQLPYTIHNSLGQLVYKGTLQNTSEKMDLSFLPSGCYSLKLIVDSQIETLSILKD